MKIAAIIPAAGLGTRMGSEAKQYLKVEGRELLWWTLRSVAASEMVESVSLVVPEADIEAVKERYSELAKVDLIVAGGVTRAISVANGVKATEADIVVIHDAARPCLSTELLERTITAAKKYGAATAAIQATDTLKLKNGKFLGDSVDRANILQIQTPQVFKRSVLLDAYAGVDLDKEWTDETSLLHSLGIQVASVEGDATNIKVTRRADLEFAGHFLARKKV